MLSLSPTSYFAEKQLPPTPKRGVKPGADIKIHIIL